MSWLQIRLAVTPENAARHEDLLLAMGAVSVTFMDAEDQPIYEPELGTTPCGAKPICSGCLTAARMQPHWNRP